MSISLKKIAWMLILCLVAPTACAKRTTKLELDGEASGNPEVEKVYREGQALFAKNRLEVADESFATLIREYPDDPLVRSAWIFRARICLAGNDANRARSYLAKVTRNEDAVSDRAVLYDGVALHVLKQDEAAMSALEPLVGNLTDEEENITLLTTLWQAAKAVGKTEEAIVALDRLLSHLPEGQAHLETLNVLKELVSQIGDPAALRRLAKRLPGGEGAWSIVMSRRASIELEAGRFKESAELLEEVERQQGTVDTVQRAKLSEVEEVAKVDLKTIGLMVPLSGRARLVGETVVKGVMLAAKELDLDVQIRDSGGDPERVGEAVQQLVEKEHVVAIIGPLDTDAAAFAAQKAESLRVPLLVLALKESLPESDSFVFRPFASSRLEIRALVLKAKEGGARRCGILYPDSGFGRTMRGLYARELEMSGLALTAEVSYPPSANAFSDQARKLATEEIDVLFLPDSASRIALIAPALAAAGLWSAKAGEEPKGPGRGIQLIVPSIGYSEDLVRRAGRYLDGALFTLFFSPEASPVAKEFKDHYFMEYAGEPSYLAAFGYDAVILIGTALQKGATDREGIRNWLSTSASSKVGDLRTTTRLSGFTKTGSPLLLPWMYQMTAEGFMLVQ